MFSRRLFVFTLALCSANAEQMRLRSERRMGEEPPPPKTKDSPPPPPPPKKEDEKKDEKKTEPPTSAPTAQCTEYTDFTSFSNAAAYQSDNWNLGCENDQAGIDSGPRYCQPGNPLPTINSGKPSGLTPCTDCSSFLTSSEPHSYISKNLPEEYDYLEIDWGTTRSVYLYVNGVQTRAVTGAGSDELCKRQTDYVPYTGTPSLRIQEGYVTGSNEPNVDGSSGVAILFQLRYCRGSPPTTTPITGDCCTGGACTPAPTLSPFTPPSR